MFRFKVKHNGKEYEIEQDSAGSLRSLHEEIKSRIGLETCKLIGLKYCKAADKKKPSEEDEMKRPLTDFIPPKIINAIGNASSILAAARQTEQDCKRAKELERDESNHDLMISALNDEIKREESRLLKSALPHLNKNTDLLDDDQRQKRAQHAAIRGDIEFFQRTRILGGRGQQHVMSIADCIRYGTMAGRVATVHYLFTAKAEIDQKQDEFLLEEVKSATKRLENAVLLHEGETETETENKDDEIIRELKLKREEMVKISKELKATAQKILQKHRTRNLKEKELSLHLCAQMACKFNHFDLLQEVLSQYYAPAELFQNEDLLRSCLLHSIQGGHIRVTRFLKQKLMDLQPETPIFTTQHLAEASKLNLQVHADMIMRDLPVGTDIISALSQQITNARETGNLSDTVLGTLCSRIGKSGISYLFKLAIKCAPLFQYYEFTGLRDGTILMENDKKIMRYLMDNYGFDIDDGYDLVADRCENPSACTTNIQYLKQLENVPLVYASKWGDTHNLFEIICLIKSKRLRQHPTFIGDNIMLVSPTWLVGSDEDSAVTTAWQVNSDIKTFLGASYSDIRSFHEPVGEEPHYLHSLNSRTMALFGLFHSCIVASTENFQSKYAKSVDLNHNYQMNGKHTEAESEVVINKRTMAEWRRSGFITREKKPADTMQEGQKGWCNYNSYWVQPIRKTALLLNERILPCVNISALNEEQKLCMVYAFEIRRRYDSDKFNAIDAAMKLESTSSIPKDVIRVIACYVFGGELVKNDKMIIEEMLIYGSISPDAVTPVIENIKRWELLHINAFSLWD